MTYVKNEAKSDLYVSVGNIAVNGIQRERALDSLRQAEKIVSAILWAAAAARRLFTREGRGTGGLMHNH
jgi:hypothetical protein